MTDDNMLQDQVNHSAQRLAAEASEAGEQVAHAAHNTIADARRSMIENASIAKEKASDALLNAAEALRMEAAKTKNEELVRQAHHLAGGIEKTALYLDSRTLDQMGEDASEVVRANPLQTVGIVFVFGLILGLLFGGKRRY